MLLSQHKLLSTRCCNQGQGGWSSSTVSVVKDNQIQYKYSTVQYSTVRYSTVQYSAVQCSAVQLFTVQQITIQLITVQQTTGLCGKLFQKNWTMQILKNTFKTPGLCVICLCGRVSSISDLARLAYMKQSCWLAEAYIILLLLQNLLLLLLNHTSNVILQAWQQYRQVSHQAFNVQPFSATPDLACPPPSPCPLPFHYGVSWWASHLQGRFSLFLS